MGIVEKLDALRNALGLRGVGHTTVMRQGSDNIDCVVVAHDARWGKEIAKRYVTLDTLERLRGLNLPVFVDNHALILLFGGAIDEIDRLKTKVNNLQRTKKIAESV